MRQIRGGDVGPEYIEPVQNQYFGYLPWAELNESDLSPSTNVPEKYYNELSDTYSGICGDSNVISVRGQPDGRFVQTTPFIETYANYAASFRDGSFLRRLSYLFSWNGNRWVKNDFAAWLDGGRMCAEGTPGYEKFMPQGEDAMPRSVAQALLGTRIFHYDSEKRRIVLDENTMDLDFDSERAKRRLASQAGFREIRPDDPVNVYRNEAGDLLVIKRQAITWSSAENRANIGAHFGSSDDALSEHIFADHHSRADVEVLLVRNGTGSEFPLLENVEKILAYIDGIEGDLIPDENRQLPLEEVLAAFGYNYSGRGDATAVGDYFYRVAMNYEMAAGMWVAPKSEAQEADVRSILSYNAAEQYYLAAAVSLATGRFITATSMLGQMEQHLRKAGIDFDEELKKIEGAISRLNERSYRRNSGGPRNSGGVAGGSGEEITSAESAAASTGAAYSIEEDCTSFQEEFGPEEEFDGWFGSFFPWEEPAFGAVGIPY